MKNTNLVLITLLSLTFVACGGAKSNPPAPALPPVGVADADGVVVHGRAVYTVENTQQTAMMKLFDRFLLSSAFASSNGSSNVTYTNAGSTNFAINVAALTAGGFTGNTLSLGSVALSGLSDNNLKVCGSGSAKCTQAIIRVYTTGSTAGFVNTADSYGVPVYTGTLNPNSQVGLGSAGSVQVQTLALGASKHTAALADFPSPTYAVTADFSNAGAGNYSMTYVVEYALQ